MRRRGGLGLVAMLCGLTMLSACVADPPPADDLRQEGEEIAPAPVEEGAGGITIAVDALSAGFNPHLIGEQGTSTDLVSNLVWPSAFVLGDDGELTLNTDLLDSAEVIDEEPFTVRYVIAQAAQWSDSSPIAVEDFEYLWQQMTTQPGVVDPSGYERIRDVRAGAGGKVVDVEFGEYFENWPSLFSHLLPAHLLRNIQNGFLNGLNSGPQVSGGPFMVHSIDLGRGEIEFVPNDRYWAAAPAVDQVVVRRSVGTGAVGQALRSTPSIVALVRDTGVNQTVAGNIGGLNSASLFSTSQLELGFNVTAEAGGDEVARRAAAAALDRGDIARIVTGETEPQVARFPFGPQEPVAGAAAVEDGEVAELLGEAGYEIEDGRWSTGGQPLHFTIGADPADPDAVVAANTVADQLRMADISARVWELDTAPMFADALPNGLVDAVVSRQRLVGDPVTAAESRFGCAAPVRATGDADEQEPEIADGTTSPTARERLMTTEPDLQPPGPGETSPTPTGTGDTTTVETTPPTTPQRQGTPTTPARGANVTGFCDPGFDALVDEASDAGDADGREAALSQAAELLDTAAVWVPLVAPGRLVVSGPDVSGLPEPDLIGTEGELLTTIATWEKTP